MFAIVNNKGKQYKVQKDQILSIDKIDAKVGDSISFDSVLFVGDDKSQKIGTPTIDGATVAAKILEHKKDDKIIVFKNMFSSLGSKLLSFVWRHVVYF